MSIRFIKPWNGYQPGDVATLGNESDLIAGGIARDAAEDDNAGADDLQAQIDATEAKLPTVAGDYLNDAAAEAGGVAVGALYHTAGAVKVRLS